MSRKGGEIEIATFGLPAANPFNRGVNMGGTSPRNNPPPQESGAPSVPPPPIENDDVEDGDFATPKRDRTGNDDEPL